MEILSGRIGDILKLSEFLNDLRRSPINFLEKRFPKRLFIRLSNFLEHKDSSLFIEKDLFKYCVNLFYRNHKKMFKSFKKFPFERVFISVDIPNKNPSCCLGGYYSYGQSYYNLEQVSITSILGFYSVKKYNKELVTLELLRSYLHDSIHFNSFREYRLKDVKEHELLSCDNIHRIKYGFNVRNESGISFSNIDKPGTKSTRNLGVIMEGITDESSKKFISNFIEGQNLNLKNLSLFENMILDEITNTSRNIYYNTKDGIFTDQELRYISLVNKAYIDVWNPFHEFMNEFSFGKYDSFTGLLMASMISGNQDPIRSYFDKFLKKGSFEEIFKSPHFIL